MLGIVSCTSLDYIGAHIVPVIASFSTDGDIKPLYVRIDGQPRKIRSYKEKNRYHNGIDFACRIEMDDRIIPVTVSYFKEEDKWGVPSYFYNEST